jgi:hypothetical protein
MFPTHLGLLRGVYVKSDFPFTNAHGHVYFYAVRWDAADDVDNLRQYAIGNPSNPPGQIGGTPDINWTWDGTGDRPPLPQGVDPPAVNRGYAFGGLATMPPQLQPIAGLATRPTRVDLQYD